MSRIIIVDQLTFWKPIKNDQFHIKASKRKRIHAL